jgi:hypothetical protein
MASLAIPISFSQLAAVLLSAAITYHLLIALYNLTLHPLASIPGPKLAALTQGYQTFHCYRRGRSQYYLEVKAMHDHYGPIVRICPNEISLRDPADFDRIYNVHSRYTKDLAFYKSMGVKHGLFIAGDNERHRRLRGPWNAHFAKSSINGDAVSALVRRNVDLLSTKLAEELRKTGTAPMHYMFQALLMDVTSEYTLPGGLGMLEKEQYAGPFTRNIFSLSVLIWVIMYSSVVRGLVRALEFVSQFVDVGDSQFVNLFNVSTRAHVVIPFRSQIALLTHSQSTASPW